MTKQTYTDRVRDLLVVLGDQLNRDSAVFDDADKDLDAVLMMEVDEEATYITQHKIRLVLFFSAMRHFRDELAEDGWRVHYAALDDRNNRGDFMQEIGRWINKARPARLVVVQPGDWRVLQCIRKAADDAGCELVVREDRHFYCTIDDFADYAADAGNLVLERFYRRMRRRHGILMDGDRPVGGRWNFDKDNRASFGKSGPDEIKAPRAFRPDDLTREVIELVERRFADNPGDLTDFDYPVTHVQARAALRDFVEHRLAGFGEYQDAMVVGHPYLYHSRLSAALNLHLLDPHDAVDAALDAYQDEKAPLNAVEGFVRQILGWREFVRGIYWSRMPDYAGSNALDADRPMPGFMWTGETDMRCVHLAVEQLKRHAYAHHIQRLMVLGQYALLLGVRPDEVNRWHLSMYVDAVDWVSVPNVLGMSQYADGGVIGTKPYAASGRYIDRMSDYCKDCRYRPGQATGEDACPFTTLYWDFLSRNRQKIGRNRRLGLQYKNLDRKNDTERRAIRERAKAIRQQASQQTVNE